MKLKTRLFGKVYVFRDVKDVLAKANEEKSGDKLAGLAAESAEERVAAKVVLSEVLLQELRENPVVPYEDDEVTRIIQDDLNERMRLPARDRRADVQICALGQLYAVEAHERRTRQKAAHRLPECLTHVCCRCENQGESGLDLRTQTERNAVCKFT